MVEDPAIDLISLQREERSRHQVLDIRIVEGFLTDCGPLADFS